MPAFPTRIVCLSAETTETLYLLGEERRIVGVSAFASRPARARREKPRVSSFINASVDRIRALRPDLVLGYSDLQAEMAAELIRCGMEVHVFNQRSIAGILRMIRVLGGLVGAHARATSLIAQLEDRLAAAASRTAEVRPRVYFEEWDEPHICGIQWVSELIELAGGDDCFADRATAGLARERIVSDDEILRKAPEVIIGSWCGKRVRPQRIAARSGWGQVPAVREAHIYALHSDIILQPGPGALTEGLDALRAVVEKWRAAHGGGVRTAGG